eukprot:847055-Rhodomonas_salina.1
MGMLLPYAYAACHAAMCSAMRLTLRVHVVVCRVHMVCMHANAGVDRGRVIPSLAMNQDAGLDA